MKITSDTSAIVLQYPCLVLEFSTWSLLRYRLQKICCIYSFKFDRKSKTNGQKDGHKNYFRHICNSSLVYLYGLRIIHPAVAEIQITPECGKGHIQIQKLIESQRQTDRRADMNILSDTSAIHPYCTCIVSDLYTQSQLRFRLHKNVGKVIYVYRNGLSLK